MAVCLSPVVVCLRCGFLSRPAHALTRLHARLQQAAGCPEPGHLAAAVRRAQLAQREVSVRVPPLLQNSQPLPSSPTVEPISSLAEATRPELC